MKFTHKETSHKKGFTIIETLVAISILAIALTGPLSIISQALRNSFYARDQVTAFYLAQEAIEYLRNQRDNNALKDPPEAADDWLAGVVPKIYSGVRAWHLNESGESRKMNLERSSSGYTLKMCPSGVCGRLKYWDPENVQGYATYGEGAGPTYSRFTREIIFSIPPYAATGGGTDDDAFLEAVRRELVVTVRVKWNTPSGSHSVLLRDNLNNWQLDKF